ncbi:PilN domain-containing protein [Cyanobium sp. Alchichica 3B3-8F6]|uniref:PilN domain-containing protein n=1 Tax=Cyanobium sp. Alchichica 3B3-8F6 TaxID=2823696 RepID=UPI0020CF2771|nr:PilN domain-containing protein [Cyanobium sp. Alchichica 3B3-8F6]MCP9882238.1 PilN domain-containing protein [Cyanobium sp. Alchichica 3B3-8F6]
MTTTPTTSQFDLLREKRQELNLPEPVVVGTQGRQRLVQGVAIGAALIGLSLGMAVLVLLRALMVSAAVDRLGTVEAEVQLFETQLTAARGKLKRVENANADLVKGLIAVRSGSALMRDLQLRVPAGVQLTAATEEGSGYRLKGVSRDPQAFARINALQLQLKRSPLLDPNGVTLVKASRGAAGSGPVSFELLVTFRPPVSPLAEKQILTQLGAEGLVRRLDLLQQEGLL